GDGFVDLVVGAPFATVGTVMNNGIVYVFKGSMNGLQSANPIVINGPDGGVFGQSLATGDIDGDGYGDIVVGAQGVAVGGGNSGRVYVYFGGPSGPRAQPAVRDSPEGGTYPRQVTVLDMNGDGYADVVATTNQANIGGTIKGRVYAYSGSSSGPAMMPTIVDAGSFVGQYGLTPAGDLDGDGFPDLLAVNGGTAAVYRGSATGIVATAAWTFSQP